jgi:hypothetical protein
MVMKVNAHNLPKIIEVVHNLTKVLNLRKVQNNKIITIKHKIAYFYFN